VSQSLEKFHLALTFTSLPPGYVPSMSATWTCICGTTFLDYGAIDGDVIRCPECGFVVGESLPTQFESPTTFQSEPPPARVTLASPEVAVQATEPSMKPRSQAVIDELAEPDIRVKPERLKIKLAIVLGFIFCGMPCLATYFLLCLPPVVDSEPTALVQVHALSAFCAAYQGNNGDFPATLATLLQQDKLGVIHVDDPAKLIDPWGRLYQYDPKGPNNKGLQPDIWVVTPKGKLIGNWQPKR